MKSLALTLVFWATTTIVFKASGQPFECRIPSTVGCGSVVDFINPLVPDQKAPMYSFAELEKTGLCKRTGIQYTNKSVVCMQDTTVGACTCINTECENCIKDKKTADVEKCCGSTTSFTYNSLSFDLLDHASKNPKCCRAHGTDSMGNATSVCYCEAATEGCFNLCPALPTGRIFGGTKVEACGTGTVRITNGEFVMCNGIYAYNPTGIDDKGGKLLTPVVYLPKVCTGGLDVLLSVPALAINLEVTVGNNTFRYNASEITRKPVKNTFFEILSFDKYTGPCMDKPVCTYNSATMASAINKRDCNLLSYGADQMSLGGNPSSSGNLNTLPIYQVGAIGTCNDPSGALGECFFPQNVAAFTCNGDVGAPIFCSLNTGEKVLYGSFAQTTKCGPDQKLFPVVPLN